jgi:uncharacterized protein YkwD
MIGWQWVIRVTVAALAVASGCGDGDGGGPPDPPPPDCPELAPITCAVDVGFELPLAMSGTTSGAEDGFGGASCGRGGDAIPDAAFRWTAPRAGEYRITTAGSMFDTVLVVHDGSCAGRELSCDDDGAGAQASAVRLELAACQTITVVVDGFDVMATGAFELSISGREGVCDDGVDDDGDGAADCADEDCFGAACRGPDDWPVAQADAEWQVLTLVNQLRAMGTVCNGVMLPPVPPLEMDETLRLAARLHSQDMADNGYFSHTSQDGRTLTDRLVEQGFTGAGPFGENIALGYTSAESVVDGWRGSTEGHCENMMSGSYRFIGVGYAVSGDRHLWTQDFARGQ